MHYKKFTSVSEMVHKAFVCKEWYFDFKDLGIDFLLKMDINFGIEMKCKKRYRKTVTFVCSAAQVESHEATYGAANLVWLFMLYDLNCKVSSIRSASGIEQRVANREIWLMPWEFIRSAKLHSYPSWGPHYHFTTKDLANVPCEVSIINGVCIISPMMPA